MGLLRDYFLPRGYRYYDTPEGEDCDKKLWYVTKECTIYGIAGSTLDVFLYSHPKGYMQTLGRYAYITFPVIGMGAAFVITTCMATNIRKKDDVFNYFLGGCAIGGVMGAWKKSIKVGVYGGAAIGLFMLIRKHCLENGWSQFSTEGWGPPQTWDIWSNKRDFTILHDPPRTWKISADE